jgi:hypothetical protein
MTHAKDEALKLAIGKIKSARDCHFAAIDPLLFEAEEILEQALAAQHEPENEPHVSLASVQEPVAWMFDCGNGGRMYAEDLDASVGWLPLYTTPPAQPSVPDAMTSADIQEHIEYVAGWNECRQAMLEMMK